MVDDYVVGYLLVMVIVDDVEQVDMLTDVIDVVVGILLTVQIVLLVELLVMVLGVLVSAFNVLLVNMVAVEAVILARKESIILTKVEPVLVNVPPVKQVDIILILLVPRVMLVLKELRICLIDLDVKIVLLVVMLLEEVLVFLVVLVLIILTHVKVHVSNVLVVNSKTRGHKSLVKPVEKVNILLLQVTQDVPIVVRVVQVMLTIILV
jgi:hypothetical protein